VTADEFVYEQRYPSRSWHGVVRMSVLVLGNLSDVSETGHG
jgi:hypothetical protein